MKFKAYGVGLFYCDVSDCTSFYYGTPKALDSVPIVPVQDKSKPDIIQYSNSHVQTVASNKALYSAQEIAACLVLLTPQTDRQLGLFFVDIGLGVGLGFIA